MIKQICQSGAIQMIPTSSGIVFAIKQEQSIYEDTTRIGYRMFNCDSGETSVVTRNVFLLSKFGNNFTKFENTPREFLEYKSVTLPNHNVLIISKEGAAELIRYDGVTVWKGSLTYNSEAPHSASASEDGVWVTYRESGALIRYSCITLRPEVRIGGRGELSLPEGVWAGEDRVLVCTAGTNSITEVDYVNFRIFEHEKFSRTPHDYVKLGANEIILLDSGIYRL